MDINKENINEPLFRIGECVIYKEYDFDKEKYTDTYHQSKIIKCKGHKKIKKDPELPIRWSYDTEDTQKRNTPESLEEEELMNL